MPHDTSTNSASGHHRLRRDAIELAALFAAVGSAELLADLVAHGPDGPALLAASAAALTAAAGFHTWWSRHHSHSPPGTRDEFAPVISQAGDQADSLGGSALWRLRTTVRDTPGSLAAVCAALAGHGIDILTLQTHPLTDGTVDEFLLRVPVSMAPGTLTRAVAAAGGRDSWLERADTHDLVDTPTKMLTLATRTAMDAAELPLALRQLFGRCTIRSVPASRSDSPALEDVLDGSTMRLRDPSGGTITVERAHLPFTPTEFARARALIELDAQLGVRMPDSKDILTLGEGNEITIRRAGPEDLPAARSMHQRCSPATLSRRYRGPAEDADRYLVHLLSPRFGQTLAAETSSGRLIALAHLLWDGDENEVALVVEDEWQRRGIGAELLRKLVTLAAEAGRDSVYAVTEATNTGMVATMRALSLPLDYQVEDSTLVVTAAISSADVASPSR